MIAPHEMPATGAAAAFAATLQAKLPVIETARLRLRARCACRQLRDDNVFQRREFRQQMVELIDKPQQITPGGGVTVFVAAAHASCKCFELFA